jgi:hypothetical protein
MKHSHYFPHDINSKDDEKCLKIRAKFNNLEGYGLVWMILESMAASDDGSIDRENLAPYSLAYGVAIAPLIALVDFCVEIGMFKTDQKSETRIFSQRMRDFCESRKHYVISGQLGALKRWGNSPPNSPPKQTLLAEKKRIEKNIYPKKVFTRPKSNEAEEYAKSIGFTMSGEAFCDFYESKGWKVGQTPMKDWRAAVRTWKRSNYGGGKNGDRTTERTGLGKVLDRVFREKNDGKRVDEVPSMFRGVDETEKV